MVYLTLFFSNKMVRKQKGHSVWPQAKLLVTQRGAAPHGDQKMTSTDLSPSNCYAWTQQKLLLRFLIPALQAVCWSRGSKKLTSRENDNTTSDLESWFSFSSPMSIIEVLWLRFSFCSLNSEPPLDTGMLSKFAIRRLTDDFSSSMYMFSISLDTNFGNLRSLDSKTKATGWVVVRSSNHLLHWENPPGASAERSAGREQPQTSWQIAASPCAMQNHYC